MFDSVGDALTWYWTIAREPPGSCLGRVIQVTDRVNSGGELPPFAQGRGEYDKSMALAAEIGKSLSELHAADRDLLELRYRCGYTWREIARCANRAQSTVRYRHARVISQMSALLSCVGIVARSG